MDFAFFNMDASDFNMTSARLHEALYKGCMYKKRILFFHTREHSQSKLNRPSADPVAQGGKPLA